MTLSHFRVGTVSGGEKLGTMRFAKPLALGFAVVAIAAVTCVPKIRTRGVRLLDPSEPVLPANFVEQSAALFVGVREFRRDRSLRLQYAVDDAIDLAWVFAFDPRLHLVDARRVTLALSGNPEAGVQAEAGRADPRRRARLAPADDLLRVAREQAALAEKDGLLIDVLRDPRLRRERRLLPPRRAVDVPGPIERDLRGQALRGRRRLEGAPLAGVRRRLPRSPHRGPRPSA